MIGGVMSLIYHIITLICINNTQDLRPAICVYMLSLPHIIYLRSVIL